MHWSYLNIVGVVLSIVALVVDRGTGGAHRVRRNARAAV